MNKNRFRVLFNKLRGVMMVVPESATHRSQAGKSSTQSDSKPFTLVTLKPIAFALLVLTGQAVLLPVANADGIVVDQSASSNQQPMITNTASGITQVNIQTPSAGGVSRNTYTQFDVGQPGVILNNSITNVQTQLGGFIQGNPYLGGGTARVILNEVNSSNPSLLNGYIEVAGSRAQVVIANPAGISCDGCGFINANRATLTTGTPIMNSGNLMGYRVGGSTINFLGAGLDTTQANYTDVIARAVQVNAGIFANTLNVVTGTNQVNVDSSGNPTTATPIAPNSGNPAPSFAVDVAALGGMYAGKIHLIGTESGLGVRNAGTLGAAAGEITVGLDGMLNNTGVIQSKTNVALNSTGLDGNGSLAADKDIAITLSSDYDNVGSIQAGNNLSLQTTGRFTNHSLLVASNNLELNAQNVDNALAGEISAFVTQLNVTGSRVEILAHSGGKTFGGFNAFAVLGGNKKIGMPETNDMTWSHHEFSVSATNPLTIAVTLQNDGQNASGRFYSSGCGPIAGYFNPEPGKDYDAALMVERDRCYLRIRELVPNTLTGEVKPSEIALTPASICR